MTTIDTSNYSIHIGKDSLSKLADFTHREEKKYSRILVMMDENTKENCWPILTFLPGMGDIDELLILSGEEYKNIDTCKTLWKKINDCNTDRKALLINVGGGVIGDMGGFVASTFKRGIDFVNVPTTLLAMVDASVGGKLGVDMDGLKNIIGVFNEPKAVIVYPPFLETLDKTQILAGFAEIIKHALIYDMNYWYQIQDFDVKKLEALEALIIRSVEIKKDVVSQDPHEMGLRKILNFGHTIGHAIETYSLSIDTKPLLHGEAIAIGMIAEGYLSVKHGKLTEGELSAIVKFILKYFSKYKFTNESIVSDILPNMVSDKKNEYGTINFTFIDSIGKASFNHTCSNDEIKEALNYYQNL